MKQIYPMSGCHEGVERRREESRSAGLALFVAALFLAMIAPGAFAVDSADGGSQAGVPAREVSDLRGAVDTHDGQRIRVNLTLGNVIIKTQDSGKIDYTVHLEADGTARGEKQLLKSYAVTTHEDADGVVLRGVTTSKLAAGHLWVTLTLNVPANYNVEVTTGGGNIQLMDLNGQASLTTEGGNIVTGNTTGALRVVTKGGHITAHNVGGDFAATTGGGHIVAGTIGGIATLHTDGGHIQVASIGGPGHLTTGGGNVSVEHSGNQLVAETVGGLIEVGEAAGQVQAKTAGGGIHVVRTSGPTSLESSGGSIYLTQVDSDVKASTGNGSITAWFVAAAKKSESNCELKSSEGDIVVYIPRQMPVTIDATIQSDERHQFYVDPAFRLLITRDPGPNGAETLHAVGSLNGGGEVVHLRTISGNIRLIASDAAKQVEIYKQQMHQIQANTHAQHAESDSRAEAAKVTP